MIPFVIQPHGIEVFKGLYTDHLSGLQPEQRGLYHGRGISIGTPKTQEEERTHEYYKESEQQLPPALKPALYSEGTANNKIDWYEYGKDRTIQDNIFFHNEHYISHNIRITRKRLNLDKSRMGNRNNAPDMIPV